MRAVLGPRGDPSGPREFGRTNQTSDPGRFQEDNLLIDIWK